MTGVLRANIQFYSSKNFRAIAALLNLLCVLAEEKFLIINVLFYFTKP